MQLYGWNLQRLQHSRNETKILFLSDFAVYSHRVPTPQTQSGFTIVGALHGAPVYVHVRMPTVAVLVSGVIGDERNG